MSSFGGDLRPRGIIRQHGRQGFLGRAVPHSPFTSVYDIIRNSLKETEKCSMFDEIVDEATQKMKSTLSVFREELSKMRSGRASTALVDRMLVEYYGQDTELRQLASISTPEAMLILIRPYDKTAVKSIEKAIQMSDIGVNPNVDGENIRLNMPALTMERRKDLVKFLNRRMEDTRVAIRNIRRSANSDLQDFEKEKLISEDERKRGEVEVQKLTDSFIKQIDELGADKEKDIMEV